MSQLQKIPVEKFRGGLYNRRDGTDVSGKFSGRMGEGGFDVYLQLKMWFGGCRVLFRLLGLGAGRGLFSGVVGYGTAVDSTNT